MERKGEPPASKYLGTFFLDSAQKSDDRSSGNSKSSVLPPKKDVDTSKFKQCRIHTELEETPCSNVSDDIWGNDFPEDFSEDCIILEPKSFKSLRDPDVPISVIDESSSHKSTSDDNDVMIISSNSEHVDFERDKVPQPNLEKRKTDFLTDQFSNQSLISKKSFSVATTSKILITPSSQTFTTEWLRNQLDKVNKDYSSLKESLIAKDGESSLLRGKLRDAEQEIQKIKQQWQTASLKERTKFEEQIKSLEKQLNAAKTQILFKSKEAESNLERYLEIKRLSIKEPESTQLKSSSNRFRSFPTVIEPSAMQEHSKDVSVNDNQIEIHVKKNVDAEISQLDTKLNMGKELEFFIHPDLFSEAALEFNFVIPPSTDYYPFNVMYKDIKEMPSDDSSYEPINLYNIWKVKKESFGEIMSNAIDITSDSDSDSDTESPQKEKSLYKILTDSGLALKRVNDDFPSSKSILNKPKTLEDKNTFEKENDPDKKMSPNVELVQTIKGSHPRLAYLGKSRYFTSLREIYLPLIEMCKSSSWEQKAIDEVFKHVKNMTRELYVAMCDPSVDAYFSTMHLRDNEIIDSCSDLSELKLEYNVFSPKKWRDKEIYVDLRRGIALIKILCDLDPKCMEVVLNSALNKVSRELPMKPTKKKTFDKGKHSVCCSKSMEQPHIVKKKVFRKSRNEPNKKEVEHAEGMKNPPQESKKRDPVSGDGFHIANLPKVNKQKRIKKKVSRPVSFVIEPVQPWSWNFMEEGVQSALGNENSMTFDVDDSFPNINITIAYEDEGCKEKIISDFLPSIEKLSNENRDEEKLSGDQQPIISINENRSSLVKKQSCMNPLYDPSASDINPTIPQEEKLNPGVKEFSHKIHGGSESTGIIEEENLEFFNLDKKEALNQINILESTMKNDQQGWVEAIKSPLLTINEKSSSKQIIALRDSACCSEAEKEFLTCALSTFNKIKSNMKSGYSIEEDKGKKRKFSEESSGYSKKLALDFLYEKDEAAEGRFISIQTEDKLTSENIKPSGNSFSFKRKRDIRPLRKSNRDDAIPGCSKEEPNLDQEIEIEIQKIFNKPLEPKSDGKKKGKLKEIDSFNCDDLYKTDKLKYFSILAHSGDFLVLIFEIIREIGRKIYTTNFNYLFAVIINLINSLLKNGNPGLIERNFLFDILQEILYCRPSPIALLQMNKLLVDVIPFQPFLTSLMCHNADSNHMVLDTEPVFFTRGACFVEVICSLIDYFMNESDWEIQTYCVRWLSYMYLIEKTTIEEWYSTQKTICRRCHCLGLLTSMAVKIFEKASSYYLRCCIENRLTYLLSCQLLEIIQSGVKVLYVMIDFDKKFSENVGDRYGMFLRFLDTVKLIHNSPEQFKEFNTNNKDLDIVQLLLIEEKVVDSIAKMSKTSETINDMADLFSTSADWPPKSFQDDKLFLSEISD